MLITRQELAQEGQGLCATVYIFIFPGESFFYIALFIYRFQALQHNRALDAT